MAFSEEDVLELLRIIDESEIDELRLEAPGLSLHVRRGGTTPAPVAQLLESRAERPTAPETGRPSSHDAVMIESPMLGTFYRAEAPGAGPFVEVGVRVQPHTIVCLIEVMKLMNSIPAGIEGTIVEVVAVDAGPVERGQPLFRVEPAA